VCSSVVREARISSHIHIPSAPLQLNVTLGARCRPPTTSRHRNHRQLLLRKRRFVQNKLDRRKIARLSNIRSARAPDKASTAYRPSDFLILAMPFSFHSHSGQFCHHAHGRLEDMVRAAIDKGMMTYGLSEHMPRDLEDLYPEEVSPPDLASSPS
jgi:hypothetical protein